MAADQRSGIREDMRPMTIWRKGVLGQGSCKYIGYEVGGFLGHLKVIKAASNCRAEWSECQYSEGLESL